MTEVEFQEYLKGEPEDAKTQCEMGKEFAEGKYTIINYQTAFQWFLKSANQGNYEAMTHVAHCYFRGAGVEKDYSHAGYWYLKASEGRFRDGIYFRKYYERSHYPYTPEFKSYPGLMDAANRGCVDAYTTIGNCFFLGKAGYYDYTAAIEWYEKAAKLNNPEALFALGFCYLTGAGCHIDYEKGFSYLERSVMTGYFPAVHNLAVCHANGLGTIENKEMANRYIEQLIDESIYKHNLHRLCSIEDLWHHRMFSKMSFMVMKELADES